MANRILIDLGDNARFRVSKPGVNVLTASPQDCSIHEGYRCLRGVVSGSEVFSGSGTVTRDVSISGLTGPFYVTLRASDNIPSGWFISALLVNNTTLRLRNAGAPRTIFYSVYGNRLDESN